MGPKGSEIWNSMLDSAEEILRERGYGALTSRLVAENIGVKQRLVYYYFQTMDELIVETFRRLAIREIERIDHALASEHSLRKIWDVCIHTTDTRLISEFMALANRIEPLRQEVRGYIEQSRDRLVTALTRALNAVGAQPPLPPVAIVIFATNAALQLPREAQIGISNGHAEVIALIEGLLATWDPED